MLLTTCTNKDIIFDGLNSFFKKLKFNDMSNVYLRIDELWKTHFLDPSRLNQLNGKLF